jgi:Ni/Co efflux regulator RcnB
MHKTIKTLLVTAVLAGSTGAIADNWQHGNNNGNNNSGKNGHSSSGQSGGGGGGNGGHGKSSGSGGGSSQFQVQGQGQGGGSGNHHWQGNGQTNVQGSQNWQGGNGGNGNNGNGGSRHYRQDMSGHWSDNDHGDHGHDNHNWDKGDHGNWNRGNWDRNNWQAFRDRNRSLFHLPRYVGPRGYSYRRFDRGYRLEPFFYAQQYWIDDPDAYQLPPAYGPYRWVRYYNDALLVNIYTGEVEDVMYDFFW